MTHGTNEYNEELNSLVVNGTSILGQEFSNPYLTPLGITYGSESLNNRGDKYMQTANYLFTVYTEGGAVQDCVATITEELYQTDNFGMKTVATVNLYGKNLGNICTISNFDSIIETGESQFFAVSEILTSIHTLDDTMSQSEEPQLEPYSFENYFTDGQIFECYQSNSGDNVVLTIRIFQDDSTQNGLYYKVLLAVCIGIEIFFRYFSLSSPRRGEDRRFFLYYSELFQKKVTNTEG